MIDFLQALGFGVSFVGATCGLFCVCVALAETEGWDKYPGGYLRMLVGGLIALCVGAAGTYALWGFWP